MPKISENRRLATRKKILEAARKILEARGVDGLTMRGLADAVDYTATALYQYFPSKEALLQEFRAEGWRQWMALQEAAGRMEGEPIQLLRMMASGYIQFAAANPVLYRLMLDMPDAAVGGPATIEKDPRFAPMIRVIENGVRGGTLALPRGFTPVRMAFHLWISMHGFVMLRLSLLRNYAAELDDLYEGIMRAVQSGLAAPDAE